MSLLSRTLLAINPCSFNQSLTIVRNYAARKGTRAKRAKAKVKVEIKKVGFIPHNQRNREAFLASRPKLKFDDSWKRLPTDNVFPIKYYQWITYPFKEAIQCLKENNHPEIYNNPSANVNLNVELNMEGEKKTKTLDNFHRLVAIPHPFEHGEDRRVIVFTKNEEMKELTKLEGASLVGGPELIKEIQNGAVSLSDFQYFVADPGILPELVILKGIMKRRFPNINSGTLDVDLKSVVSRLVKGINYTGLKDEFEKDFGLIQTVIGTLDMDAEEIEANFAELIKDVYRLKPRRGGTFIRRCLLWSPPAKDRLKLDHEKYLSVSSENSSKNDDDEENEQALKKQATN